MTRISSRQPLIIFALTASLGPIALAAAPRGAPITNFADNDGWYDDWCDGPVDATVTLPDGGGTLSIGLGIALREAGSLELMARLSDRQLEAQAELAEVVLRAAESYPADTRLAALRNSLPETLKEAMNARLIAMSEEPAILEVLILDWAHAP